MVMRNTIPLELPETLALQMDEQQISERELQAVLTAMLETWLAQRAGSQEAMAKPGRFSQSAIPFAKRLVAQNRALFEELAELSLEEAMRQAVGEPVQPKTIAQIAAWFKELVEDPSL